MRKNRFIISGGGTGGHIYPALSIANKINKSFNNAEIKFVGAIGRMEMNIVPKHGYNIQGLWISGLQRSFSLFMFLIEELTLSIIPRDMHVIHAEDPPLLINGKFWPVTGII